MSRAISLQNIRYYSYSVWLTLLYTFVVAVTGINMYDIPLISFTGGDVAYPLGIGLASIVFAYTPRNATLYWLRCFQGSYDSKLRHILSKSFVTNKFSAVGKIGERTRIIIEKSNNEVWIKLNIEQPDYSDDGRYCCELEGVEQAKTACLRLEGHATIDERNDLSKGSPNITSRTGVNNNTEMIPQRRDYNFLIWVCLAVVSLCILGVLIIYLWKTRKRPQNTPIRQGEEDPMV